MQAIALKVLLSNANLYIDYVPILKQQMSQLNATIQVTRVLAAINKTMLELNETRTGLNTVSADVSQLQGVATASTQNQLCSRLALTLPPQPFQVLLILSP